MVSILRKPKPSARLSKYGHDLSRRVAFSSSCGHLIPVLYDFLDGGTKVTINDHLFTRTQPLKTCALVRVNEYIDYFFVPMRTINGYWENAYFGIDDFMDSNMVNLTKGSVQGKPYSVPASDVAYLYGAFFADFFDFTNKYTDGLFYIKSNTDSFAGYALNVKNNSGLDSYGIPNSWNTLRLMHSLGYSTQLLDISLSSAMSNMRMNLHLLACYQKIWYDYYRLSQWSSNNPSCYSLNSAILKGSLDVSMRQFNTDENTLFSLRYRPLKRDFFNNIEPTPLFIVGTDYNGYPYDSGYSAQTIKSLGNYVLSAYGVQLQGYNPDIMVRSDPKLTPTSTGGMTLGEVNMQNLRLAYAYERMLLTTQRAGRHVDDQYRAHLGVNIPEGISEETYFLGSHRSQLMIGEVVATAAGADGSDSTSVLGEIAGRGLGASDRKRNKKIKFTAPCAGYIMALYSAVPEIDYKYTGINKLNLYGSIMDYPRPEFDEIGMQPLFTLQSFVSYEDKDVISTNGLVVASSISGWQYRYSELKLSYDYVFGSLLETQKDWTSAIIFGQFGGVSQSMYCPPTLLDNIFALSFKPPYWDVPGYLKEQLPDSYILLSTRSVNPAPATDVANRVSSSNSPSYRWDNSLMYSRDPFIHTIQFDYKKANYLSPYSMWM